MVIRVGKVEDRRQVTRHRTSPRREILLEDSEALLDELASAPFIANFMLPVPKASFPASEICSSIEPDALPMAPLGPFNRVGSGSKRRRFLKAHGLTCANRGNPIAMPWPTRTRSDTRLLTDW